MTDAIVTGERRASDRPVAAGGGLGALLLGCLCGGVIGAGGVVAGLEIGESLFAAWLSAIVLTVAIPAAVLWLRRGPAPETLPQDLEAWEADLEKEEIEAKQASRHVA